MNFKDLQFSIGKFKADVHSQIVKNNPLQKQDTKALSMWIFQERNDLAAMRTMAYKRSETIKALREWVKEEVEEETLENSRDLEDLVGDKLCRLLDKQVEIEQEFAAKYQQYRHAIKSIREREEKLADEREKKRTLQSRIANLQKTSPKSPKLLEFQKELRSLCHDTVESEFDLADFKRFALKEAFYLRFNAMHEFAEKTALIAGFGKYLTDLIDTEPTIKPGQPRPQQLQRKAYDKGADAAIIVADAMKALQNWKPLAEDVRLTLANSSTDGVSNDSTSIISNDSSLFDMNDPKGKLPATVAPQQQQKVPPALPPRRPTEDSIPQMPNTPNTPTTATSAQQDPSIPPPLPPKTAHVCPSIANNTGDLKTPHEVQIDIDKLDEYDAPPPANEEEQKQAAQQGSTEQPSYVPPPTIPAHKEHYATSSSLNYDPPHSPEPSSAASLATSSSNHISQHRPCGLTDSPVPYHQQSSQQQQQHERPATTIFHDPTTISSPYMNPQQPHVDYHQLYHQQHQYHQQQQQQQQQYSYPSYRPYSEFQQQVHQQQLRPKVDAGGFRIPTSTTAQNAGYMSAEAEKERLAQYYKQQESYQHQQHQHQHQQQHQTSSSGSFSSPVASPHHHQHDNNRYEQKIQENDD